MTNSISKMKFNLFRYGLLLFVVLSLYVMSPTLLQLTFLYMFVGSVTTSVIDVNSDRHAQAIGNDYVHINWISVHDDVAYASLAAIAKTAIGSVSLTDKDTDVLINELLSLVHGLRTNLAGGDITALDDTKAGIDGVFDLFYDQFKLAYIGQYSGVADSALDWETTAGTPQSQDQMKLLGWWFGREYRRSFWVKQTEKPGRAASVAYERFLRILALDALEEAAYVYPLALLQEKGLINLVHSADTSLINSELISNGFINEDFQAGEALKALVRAKSSRTLTGTTTMITIDSTDLLRAADGTIKVAQLYPKFATKYEVPVRSLRFVQKFFGLGKTTKQMGDVTKTIHFGNFFTIGDESAADKRKIGYGVDRAVKYLDTFNLPEVGIPALRAKFFKTEVNWEYEKALDNLGKREMYISVSAMTVKGFCDNTVYEATDQLFGKRSAAPTISGGIITSANQHVRADTGYLISATQAGNDGTSAFHVAPKSMVSLNDLLDYLLLKMFFQPGEAHVHTMVYSSLKAFAIVEEDVIHNMLTNDADVTDEQEQLAKMFLVHDDGVIGTCTIEVLLRDFRVIDATAPGLTLAGGYKLHYVSRSLLPDLSKDERFFEIYKEESKDLVISRFGGSGSLPVETKPDESSNDNDNDNDGDSND